MATGLVHGHAELNNGFLFTIIKMGARSYNVGSVYGEEKPRATKTQMGRHTDSRGQEKRKTVQSGKN